MLKKTLEIAIFAALTSIPLIVLGVVISRYIIGSQETLDFVLFVVGAIPIIVFLPGVFSSSTSGALHTPKVIFRKVETLEPKENKYQSSKTLRSNFLSSVKLVLAGLITWLAGYLL